MECQGGKTLDDVLTPKQVGRVLEQAVGEGWRLAGSHVRPAAPGLSGFLGDHHRVTLLVEAARAGGERRVHVFVKRLPVDNKPKASFIEENNFFRRERVMFELFEEMLAGRTDDSNPWCATAYICSDSILVMPDLSFEGYRQRPKQLCLDLKHTLLTAAALARFHAAFADYETRQLRDGHVLFGEQQAQLLKDPSFLDSPWLRAAAKLVANFLAVFSDKRSQYPANLEEILFKLFLETCDSFTECDSLNVVVHKDMWVNNIMFKYEGEVPVNALLIDFQCVRYGPPAFDLMIFLYLNTSRSFREKYESAVCRHYYVNFLQNVDDGTKGRLESLGYDYREFLGWCSKARMFALLQTMGLFPYVLMEPALAQRTFDDPATFVKYNDEDRTEPVVAHARASAPYRQRQLEVCEEFVERYVLNKL